MRRYMATNLSLLVGTQVVRLRLSVEVLAPTSLDRLDQRAHHGVDGGEHLGVHLVNTLSLNQVH